MTNQDDNCQDLACAILRCLANTDGAARLGQPGATSTEVAVPGLSDSLQELERYIEASAITPQYAIYLIGTLGLATHYSNAKHMIHFLSRRLRITDSQLLFIGRWFSSFAPLPDLNHVADKLLNRDPEFLRMTRKLNRLLGLKADTAATLTDLDIEVITHASDRVALARLRNTPGVDTAIRKYSSMHIDKVQLLKSRIQRIRVGDDQFEAIYDVWLESVRRSGTEQVPDLYIDSIGMQSFIINQDNPQVVIGNMAVSLLSPDELLFLFGHHLGQMRLNQVLYASLAVNIGIVKELVSSVTLGLGATIAKGFSLWVLDWYRKSAFSCDRFGLLVAQNRSAAYTTLMKLAGAPVKLYDQLNPGAFIEQGKQAAALETDGDKFLQMFMLAHETSPWPAVRAYELDQWERGGL